MLKPGQNLRCTSGNTIQIESFLADGGQGCAYLARSTRDGSLVVVKVLHEKMSSADARRRIAYITGLRLSRLCPVLIAPEDVIAHGTLVGYVAPYFAGQSLEEFLAAPMILPDALTERFILAAALVRAVGALHAAGVSHGDLHSGNVLVRKIAGGLEAGLIDIDNFAPAGCPPPVMVGVPLYYAPELRMALAAGRPAVPDLHCDLFSLSVLLHEIFLSAHPAAGYDETPEKVDAAMLSGWLHDPQRPGRKRGVGGLPSEILSSDLHRVFRLALKCEPAVRPSAAAWESVLLEAECGLRSCPDPACSMPFFVDPAKTRCPGCQRPFPNYVLRTKAGHIVPVRSAAVSVGRNELGGSPHISLRHATLRKIGPDLWIETVGRNGTKRWNGSDWTRLPKQSNVLLQDGDWLKFGDVAVLVQMAA